MALKDFSFRKSWVGSEVAGMKITFFAIFDPTWAHTLAPKGQNMEFLRQNLDFQSLRKIEVCYYVEFDLKTE